ncbi:hypothetical protein [Agromyces seonyuensis]|uniref:Uncharacterized protein n=1 Tax=Agromyces seonyuensis TaxID=2662446 RepID=A0A6I4P471_9MICO|nr:hypothetical protein [Agromyces seonyuensis]MWB99665.1 hypothetical protein [Agromyces seonyuensis]
MARKSWRCRIGWHKWVLVSGPEDGAYEECARCGKNGTPPTGRPGFMGG